MRLLFTNCDILVRGEDGYETLRDAYLGVDGDTICFVGTTNPTEEYDAYKNMHGALLMPGLINCHNHSAMTLLRGLGSGRTLQSWLFESIFPVEERLTQEIVSAGVNLALLEMIAGGTTSFSDMYFFPDVTVEAVAQAGMKANINRCVQCFDPTERGEDNVKVRESMELFDRFHGFANDRVRIDFAVHAEYTCTEPVVKYYADLCRGKGTRMHIHLSETRSEHEKCIEKYGKTPTQWFSDLGIFDTPTLAAHCVAVTEEDIAILRAAGVTAVHNPTSNMKLGSGFAPVRRLLDAGVNVALGTDGAASNNNLDLFEEMHLASIIHCGYHNDPTVLQPCEILDMATVNGARAQGRENTGSLAVGNRADIIAIDTGKPHLTPNLDTCALLTYAVQSSDVCMTMVDGRILYENGEFKTLDAERIMSEAHAAVRKLYEK